MAWQGDGSRQWWGQGRGEGRQRLVEGGVDRRGREVNWGGAVRQQEPLALWRAWRGLRRRVAGREKTRRTLYVSFLRGQAKTTCRDPGGTTLAFIELEQNHVKDGRNLVGKDSDEVLYRIDG